MDSKIICLLLSATFAIRARARFLYIGGGKFLQIILQKGLLDSIRLAKIHHIGQRHNASPIEAKVMT